MIYGVRNETVDIYSKRTAYSFPIPTAVRWVVNQSTLIKVQFIDFNKVIHLRIPPLSLSNPSLPCCLSS